MTQLPPLGLMGQYCGIENQVSNTPGLLSFYSVLLQPVVEVKDLRQTIAIKSGYGEMNTWLKWMKYSVCTLNKISCYTCVTGRPEPQVVSFPLGWTTDPAGVVCMVALFQEGQPGAMGLTGPCHCCFL
jgi:hypothetical protein